MKTQMTIEEAFTEYLHIKYKLWRWDMVVLYGKEKADKMTTKDFLRDNPPDKLVSKFEQYVDEIKEEKHEY